MDKLEFGYFYKQLVAGKWIDETQFYFADDPNETDRFLGYLPQYELPYWVGYCDIEDGIEFRTAEELVNAPVFNGQSLKERWDMVRIVSIEGIGLGDWITSVPHV